MAVRVSNEGVNAEVAALGNYLDNGYVRIYSGTRPATADTALAGQTLLAELRFASTAFGVPSAGVASANVISPDTAANATGTATWFRALRADGASPVFDGSVGLSGQSGYDMLLSVVDLTLGTPVTLTAMTFTQPKETPGQTAVIPMGMFDDANVLDPPSFQALLDDLVPRNITEIMLAGGTLAGLGALLDLADARPGVKVYGAPNFELDRDWWADSVAATQGNANAVAATFVSQITAHPSFGGFYVYDEPPPEALSKMQLLYTAIHNINATIPVFVVLRYDTATAYLTGNCVDVCVFPYYPYTVNVPVGTSIQDEQVPRDFIASKPAGMPVWYIAQGHRFGDPPPEDWHLRDIATSEVAPQITLAAAVGAAKVFWFVYTTQQSWTGLRENLPILNVITEFAEGETIIVPPPTIGLPVVTIPYGSSVETFWASHPLNPANGTLVIGSPAPFVNVTPSDDLQAIVDNLLHSGGGTITLAPGAYRTPAIIGRAGMGDRGNLHFIGQAGVTFQFESGVAVAPEPYALQYHTGFIADLQANMAEPRDIILNRCIKNIYWYDITFDHMSAGPSRVFSMTCVDGMFFDKCRFGNATIDPNQSFHGGHINSNIKMNNIWFRNCAFNGDLRVTLYVDSGHGCVMTGCTIGGNYPSGGPIFLCNDDATYDYDRDSAVDQFEMRYAQYTILHNNVIANAFPFEVVGSDTLLTGNRFNGSVVAAIYWSSKLANKEIPPGVPVNYDYDRLFFRNNIVEDADVLVHRVQVAGETVGVPIFSGNTGSWGALYDG